MQLSLQESTPPQTLDLASAANGQMNRRTRAGGLRIAVLVLILASGSLVNAVANNANRQTPGNTWRIPALPRAQSVWLAGPWSLAQALNAQRLSSPPLNALDFILDDATLKRHRKFAEYSGDLSGRWIGVASFLAYQYPADFWNLPDAISDLSLCQKPDGHFGVEQQFAKLERSRDMPLLWGNGRMLVGLVEVYEQTGDHQALEMAQRLGNYFIATDPIFNREENIRKIGGSYADGFVTCYFSCIEGLADLGGATGNQRFTEQAERIANLAVVSTNFDGLHSHGRLCAVRGFAELYAVTGKPCWLEAAERDWGIFSARYLLPTGGVKESLAPECRRDEGCAEADWLRLNLSLWRLTGEARFLDAAERSLRNHFLYQEFANGGAGHRFLDLIGGQPVAFSGLSEEAWWCCGAHWGRALADVQRCIVVGDSSRLFINLAVDCDATVAGPGGDWKVAVRTVGQRVNLALKAPRKLSATVEIHRPFWATNSQVAVPAGLQVQGTERAWRVAGAWHGIQTLTVTLPEELRAENGSDDSGVLFSGHDLLVLSDSSAGSWLTAAQSPARRPLVLWSPAAKPADGNWWLPVSLAPDPDPSRPEQWRLMEFDTLRSQAAIPDHRFAWFSFRPRQVDAQRLSVLVNTLSSPPPPAPEHPYPATVP